MIKKTRALARTLNHAPKLGNDFLSIEKNGSLLTNLQKLEYDSIINWNMTLSLTGL